MSCLVNIIASLESAPIDFREFTAPIVVLMSSSSRIDGPRRKGLPKRQPWSNGQQGEIQSVWQAADHLLDQIAG